MSTTDLFVSALCLLKDLLLLLFSFFFWALKEQFPTVIEAGNLSLQWIGSTVRCSVFKVGFHLNYCNFRMYTASFSASVKGQCCHQSTADEVWLQSFSFYMYNWCDVCMCVFSMDSLAQMRRSHIYEISSLCGFVLSLHYVPQDTFHSSKYWDIWLWRQWSCLLFLTWYPFWKAIYKNKYILAWWLILHCSLEYLMEILCTSERLQRKKKDL